MDIVQNILLIALKNSLSLHAINSLYNWFPSKHYFYSKSAKRIENCSSSIDSTWRVSIPGRAVNITLPLRGDTLPLHWDLALSILGHEPKIKQTWLNILNKQPSVQFTFVDVGANFGQNSLIFAAANVPTFSYEPNLICCEYIQEVMSMNNFNYELLQSAIGNSNDPIELVVPDSETWLGSTCTKTQMGFGKMQLDSFIVQQRKLDSDSAQYPYDNILLKVDVEGSELEVLNGAVNLLSNKDVVVVFEVWPEKDNILMSNRAAIYDYFTYLNYEIFTLPLNSAATRLGKDEFLTNLENNFAATRIDSCFAKEFQII